MANDNDNKLAIIDQQKDLAHLTQLETEIIGLKGDYKDLTIDGPDDKEGYKKVQAAIAVLRPKRTGLDRERKDVVRPYNELVKHINAQYDKIGNLILEGPGGEVELKVKKEAIDDVLEKEKENKRLADEKKINDRINELISNGMVFDGEYYSIKDESLGIQETSIGVVDIRTMSDELYKNFLQVVIDKAAKITAEKNRVTEKERKEKEEKDAAEKKDREEFDKNKKLLEKQQAELKKQQDDLNAQQKKIDDDKKQQEQNRINGIIRHRSAVLVGMELEYNAQAESFDYKGETLVADAPGIANYDDNAWIEFVENISNVIKKKKTDAEDFLRRKNEKEQQRQKQQEEERQAGLSDQEKVKEYKAAVLAIPVPQLKTKKWKTTLATARGWIENLPV